jgi:hypothetical protein
MASASIFKTLGLNLCSSSPSEVRRGEKVPFAFGTVADRFVQWQDLSGFQSQRSVLVLDRTGRSTLGTGLFLVECLGLFVEQGRGQAFAQASGNHSSQLFHVHEVHLGNGTRLLGHSFAGRFSTFDAPLTQLTQKIR